MVNLLNDLGGLAVLLRSEVNRGSWFNAFLLAAGMNQIAEDYVSRDPYSLGKISRRLRHDRGPLSRLGALLASATGKAIWHIRLHSPGTGRILRWESRLAALVQHLSDRAVLPRPSAGQSDGLVKEFDSIIGVLPDLSLDLRQTVVRLPACFRAFDQHPDDLSLIVNQFAKRWEDRGRRIVVVGIRTSGSYLAPLYASFLKGLGYEYVEQITVRPGQPILPSGRRVFREAVRSGGLVLLTDDPPRSGESLAREVSELERLGFPSRSIVLLLTLFGSREELPPKLRHCQSLVLPGEQWTVKQRLEPEAVEKTLAGMVPPNISISVKERLHLPPHKSPRSHVRESYRVEFTDAGSGRTYEEKILVRGVGQGYFGEHALAVWSRLQESFPHVYGVKDGILLQQWLPQESGMSITPETRQELARAIVSYVVGRNKVLRVSRDWSLGLLGRQPVWELVSDIHSRVFGRISLAVRPSLYATTKRLLLVESPSVIDGNMDISRWFRGRTPTSLLKVDFDDRAFGSGDMSCYDPVFDLAGIACSQRDGKWEDTLRSLYGKMTRQVIPKTRWLLYRLVQMDPENRASALSEYLAGIYLHDVALSRTGALCALDIDGVLESAQLGFNCTTPAGALTLRALMLHGFRPVLASGRSLNNVRDRCKIFGLPGGVAEYGAVLYDNTRGNVRDLLTKSDHDILNDLRSVLGECDHVEIDSEFQFAVRAFRTGSHGERRSPAVEDIEKALSRSSLGDRILVVPGACQIDFVPRGVSKATGLKSLAIELGAKGNGKLLAMAVGDTFSDLTMFELATLPCAPANADEFVKRADVAVFRRSFAGGLFLATGKLIGHNPGDCPVCRMPELDQETTILLETLAIQDLGVVRKCWRAAWLGAKGGVRALMHELDQRQ